MVMAVQLLRLWSMGVEIAQNNSAFQLQFAGIFTPESFSRKKIPRRHRSYFRFSAFHPAFAACFGAVFCGLISRVKNTGIIPCGCDVARPRNLAKSVTAE
jgi:hypothetical protein